MGLVVLGGAGASAAVILRLWPPVVAPSVVAAPVLVAPPAPPPPPPIDSGVTDYLRWIAGTLASDSSAAYRRFAERSAQSYAALRASKLDSIAAFASATLGAAHRARTVLYPFAGGDVVFVTEFFPMADTIVLVGLEPVGRVVDWRAWRAERRQQFLDQLTRAVSISNRMGYFVTLNMQSDFADSTLDGVVHPILMYLGWKGYAIVRLSRFDPAIPRQDEPMTAPMRGLRVRARQLASGRETVFEYVRADLSDPAIQRDSVILSYLRQWASPVVYLKAASYLLHFGNFSRTRATLLAQASAVLQDDTGFPLAALTAQFDSVAVFGTYSRPIAVFEDRFQPDLKARYDQPGIPGLGFRITYGGRSNLQLATKPKA